MGRESFAIQADVSDRESVAAMFAEVKKQWGRLDILVNNAGILAFEPFATMSDQTINSILDTNLKGQIYCSQEAVKLMETRKWGRIINIASIASGGVGIGFPQISAYTASKGGIIGLSESMAVELGPLGITVNVIAPGLIESDMTAASLQDEQMKQGMLARLPIKRIGQPEDIGAGCVYLAAEEAAYVTGSVLYIDGGWLAS